MKIKQARCEWYRTAKQHQNRDMKIINKAYDIDYISNKTIQFFFFNFVVAVYFMAYHYRKRPVFTKHLKLKVTF